MADFDRLTRVGGEQTRLTVSPPRLQFELVARNPSDEGPSGWTSKVGLCQLRQPSSCSKIGNGRVENVCGTMTFLNRRFCTVGASSDCAKQSLTHSYGAAVQRIGTLEPAQGLPAQAFPAIHRTIGLPDAVAGREGPCRSSESPRSPSSWPTPSRCSSSFSGSGCSSRRPATYSAARTYPASARSSGSSC